MSKLTKLYTDMFPMYGISLGDDGCLNLLFDYQSNDTVNYLIDNKPLVLPTQQVLKKPNWDDYVAFHPLSESATRGESEVQQSLRRAARYKIRTILAVLLVTLPDTLLEDEKKSKSHLTTAIVEKTHQLKGVTKNTIKLIRQVLEKSDCNERNQDQTVVRILSQIGGTLEGTKYSRICRIYFPLYETLVDAVKHGHAEVWGVKGSKKDIKLFKEIFEAILGEADARERDLYSAGTNSNTCPYFQSLFDALVKVYSETNYIVDILSDYIQEPIRSNIFVDMKFIDGMPTFRDVRKEVPGLAYNIGTLAEGEEEEESKAKVDYSRKREPVRAKEESVEEEDAVEEKRTIAVTPNKAALLSGGSVRKRIEVNEDEVQAFKESGREKPRRRAWEDDEEERSSRRSEERRPGLREALDHEEERRGGDRFGSRRRTGLRESLDRDEDRSPRGRGRGVRDRARSAYREDDYRREGRYSSGGRNRGYSSRSRSDIDY